jgi:hypothetical protein
MLFAFILRLFRLMCAISLSFPVDASVRMAGFSVFAEMNCVG